MFRGKNRVAEAASGALESVSPYVDKLARDEKLRQRLAAALAAGLAARKRQRRTALAGLGRTLASDPVLRGQLVEAFVQLTKAKGRLGRRRSHTARNVLVFVTVGGMVVAAVPSLRNAVVGTSRGEDENKDGGTPGGITS